MNCASKPAGGNVLTVKTPWVLFGLFLLAMLAASGCSSVSTDLAKKAWYKPGTSAEERRRDLALCQNEALVNGQSYSPIPADTAGHAILLGMLASSSESSRENQIVQTCMTAKGYTLVDTNSPLLTDSIQTEPKIPVYNAENIANFKAKAEKGDINSQFTLGVCYFYGDGVPQDYAETVKWYRKAAEQGDPDAQYSLGYCYEEGLGVPQNNLEAYIWFNLSSTHGDKESVYARDKAASRLSLEDLSEGQRRAAAFVPQPTLPGY